MAFTLAALYYLYALLAVLLCMAIIVCMVYCFNDILAAVGRDYTRLQPQMFDRINKFVLPEYAVHFTVFAIFLIANKDYEVYWNLPLLLYHMHRDTKRHEGLRNGLYHPGTFTNQSEKKMMAIDTLGKFGFYLISAAYYAFAMTYELML